MTIDQLNNNFNIKSIAVIGGGPGGLASVYEFLHTSSTGESTVGGKEPTSPAFTKIIGFEQKDRVGGTWATSIDEPDLPDENLWKDEYYDGDVIHPRVEIPKKLIDDDDDEYTVDNPLIVDGVNNDNQWRRSGVYPGLYSNVPRRFLRFSSIEYLKNESNKFYHDKIDPLVKYQEISNILSIFTKKNNLLNHYRLNTQVENVSKDPITNEWVLYLRHSNVNTGKDEWYIERFDAVVIASGHYSVPYIPYIPGLETVPNGMILHSKSFRNVKEFRNKKVLIVGSSISGVDLIQYIEPICSELIISRSPNKSEIYPWITKTVTSFLNKPKISKINGKKIYFQDGSILENVDKIIFATGYHWHYPYISEDFLRLTKPGFNSKATSGSRIEGLYYDTFNINDPTLGFVGIQLTSIQFHCLETSASALAGIWSNIKKLPTREEQLEWEFKRVEKIGNDYKFHYYPYDVVQSQWIDELFKYAPIGRKYILKDEDFSDFEIALKTAENAFHDIRNGKYSID